MERVSHSGAHGLLNSWLASFTGEREVPHNSVYWSLDYSDNSVWEPLAQARTMFGELPRRETEPDIIIVTPGWHVWVEAKLGSNNDTKPSDLAGASGRYVERSDGWFGEVVRDEFEQIAHQDRRYELLRMWLLGTWAANRAGKSFALVNLVRAGEAENIAGWAQTRLALSATRRFGRATWEDIYRLLCRTTNVSTAQEAALARYMEQKTLGFGSGGRLRRAFSIAAS